MGTSDSAIRNTGVTTAGRDAPVAAGSRYRPACPACGGTGLARVRRRPIDRLLSLFVRLRRFRCTCVECQWQGNLREPAAPRRRTNRTG